MFSSLLNYCLFQHMSIVVTGFGPFKSGSDKDNTQIDHVKNASWEGVKAFAQKWDNPDGKFFLIELLCLNQLFSDT